MKLTTETSVPVGLLLLTLAAALNVPFILSFDFLKFLTQRRVQQRDQPARPAMKHFVVFLVGIYGQIEAPQPIPV